MVRNKVQSYRKIQKKNRTKEWVQANTEKTKQIQGTVSNPEKGNTGTLSAMGIPGPGGPDCQTARLPNMHEGAGKWIRAFEEQTMGKMLAVGDLKALPASVVWTA